MPSDPSSGWRVQSDVSHPAPGRADITANQANGGGQSVFLPFGAGTLSLVPPDRGGAVTGLLPKKACEAMGWPFDAKCASSTWTRSCNKETLVALLAHDVLPEDVGHPIDLKAMAVVVDGRIAATLRGQGRPARTTSSASANGT